MDEDKEEKESYAKMWEHWMIFKKYDTTNDNIQLRKQLGLMRREKNEFSVRTSLKHPPNL
jgi:hypothetical protein